ncbi:MAG: GTP-binding protein [Candidatus Lokiarchaeota archaeon]|nr:GTP-binding protein [Candidatus Lokiarchaeota archaeon]MBD3201595.1 GTP-binding protein [Candidatus Lokiarchaeota archaeon]
MLRSTYIDETVKVSIIGFPAVGKTTMMKMLAKRPIEKKYLPTQGFDLKTVQFGDFKLRIWDFGGQKNYLKTYLKDFVVGSDLIFIVTDSTPKNVLNSRQLIDYAKEIMGDDCPIIAVANKQDLCKTDGRMDYKRVEDLLHTKTLGLTAIDPEERRRLMKTIEIELEKVMFRRSMKE